MAAPVFVELDVLLLFLAKNGFPKRPDNLKLYAAMIAIAEKHLDKTGLARVFRELVS